MHFSKHKDMFAFFPQSVAWFLYLQKKDRQVRYHDMGIACSFYVLQNTYNVYSMEVILTLSNEMF